ncbi:MAG: GIY-YIG nuclease family protein [Syntrophobacterales bacterium]|jgi:putative endonuclease|nr:GIY-YIG nuclease family protein [Syntrophobacterales bacterium]
MTPKPNATWCVYVLQCRDGSLYVGLTNNLAKRLACHDTGKGSKYVRSRRPFQLVKVISCQSAREAYQLEYHLKKLTRERKIRLLCLGDSIPPASVADETSEA